MTKLRSKDDYADAIDWLLKTLAALSKRAIISWGKLSNKFGMEILPNFAVIGLVSIVLCVVFSYIYVPYSILSTWNM